MLRPAGKPQKIAERIMKSKGVPIVKNKKAVGDEKTARLTLTGPSLQH